MGLPQASTVQAREQLLDLVKASGLREIIVDGGRVQDPAAEKLDLPVMQAGEQPR